MSALRIAMAMSGGLDSSAAASLLLDQGHDVFGLSARTWTGGSRCCSDEDIRSAQRVSDRLGIPHYVVDLHEAFERDVVRYFVDEYARGRTPSPCAVCNRQIKFGLLLRKAQAAGADSMATGHYARLRLDAKGNRRLLRGVDKGKDQSYFLFGLSQAQLASTLFPVGDMTKSRVRAYAAGNGLPTSSRGESQDLCFVEPGRHWELTESYRPSAATRGWIVDESGRRLAEHEGIHRFTVGQRKGLGLATGTVLYVKSLDAETNTVVVAERDRLLVRVLRVREVCWICGQAPAKPFRAVVRPRYAHPGAEATVTPGGEGAPATVEFDEAQFAVAPGQAAVFYVDDEVVGGGWIV